MNTNLLRRVNPVDLKVGDRVLDADGDEATVAAPSHPVTDEFVLSYQDDYGDYGYFVFSARDPVYLAPLCWVENKPVYPGDVLYWKDVNSQRCEREPLTAVVQPGGWGCEHPQGSVHRFKEGELTWTPPKREAWLNICNETYAYHYPTRAEADSNANPHRLACIRIEW